MSAMWKNLKKLKEEKKTLNLYHHPMKLAIKNNVNALI